MTRGTVLTVSLGLLLATCALPAPAHGGDFLRRLTGHVHSQAYADVQSPSVHVAAPPGPHRYPEYNAATGPWYGYGFGVPTYNWGYFGAQYRPAVVCHHGYYGDFTQWGYRQGY